MPSVKKLGLESELASTVRRTNALSPGGAKLGLASIAPIGHETHIPHGLATCVMHIELPTGPVPAMGDSLCRTISPYCNSTR